MEDDFVFIRKVVVVQIANGGFLPSEVPVVLQRLLKLPKRNPEIK